MKTLFCYIALQQTVHFSLSQSVDWKPHHVLKVKKMESPLKAFAIQSLYLIQNVVFIF